MTPDDLTQPMTPRPTPRAAQSPYHSPFNAPTTVRPPRRPTIPRAGRGPLWGALGFVVGCVLATMVALVLLAPARAPSAPAQTSGAALTVTLTDTLLTQSLGSNLGSSLGTGAVALVQPRAHIQSNGQIVISGALQGTIESGSDVTIVIQPFVSHNTLAIRVLRASVAGIALPPSMLDSLRAQVNQQLRQSSRISLGVGQSLVVTGVSFTNGAMTLTYAPGVA
jgi:hypothetical protein